MGMVAVGSHWKELLNSELLEKLDETPFLIKCREQTVTRTELHRFLQQHYFYSRNFTRFLGALLSNLVSEKDREDLSQNLFEEMGLGEVGAIPHSRIYRQMLDRMGIEVNAPIFPSTQRFIQTMLTSCCNRDPMVGLGALCLGAEAIVPHFYSQIVEGFRGIGESLKNLEFFLIHIDGDDEHALTMKKIIERELAADPANRGKLESTARDIILARADFLDSISDGDAREKKETENVAVYV